MQIVLYSFNYELIFQQDLTSGIRTASGSTMYLSSILKCQIGLYCKFNFQKPSSFACLIYKGEAKRTDVHYLTISALHTNKNVLCAAKRCLACGRFFLCFFLQESCYLKKKLHFNRENKFQSNSQAILPWDLHLEVPMVHLTSIHLQMQFSSILIEK